MILIIALLFLRQEDSSDASVYIPAIINNLSEHKNKFVVLNMCNSLNMFKKEALGELYARIY